jgi:hypothetical protein
MKQAARLRIPALLLLAPSSSTPGSASTLARTFSRQAPDYLYDAGGASHTLGVVIPGELGAQLGWDRLGWSGTSFRRAKKQERAGEKRGRGGFGFLQEERRERQRRQGEIGEGGMYV